MRQVLARASLVLIAIAATASLAAAQKVEIKINKDKDADFKAIRTYAWLPPAPLVQATAPEGLTNPTLAPEALGPPIMAAVDRELRARGLVPAPAESADVHVTYFAALTLGFSSTYLGEYYGYVTGWGSPIPAGLAPSTSMDVYEKGTVLVDIVNAKAKRAVWRATAVTRIHQELTLEKRVERINDAAARMFRQFPLPVKKQK